MQRAEFDQFADDYDKQLRETISVTGEGPEYFSDYKIADLATFVDNHSLPSDHIFDFGSGIGNSLRVLTEKPSFARLLVEKEPEPIIRTIASAAENASRRNMPLDIAGLHFFVFGGFNKTVDWIDAARGE